MDKAICLAGIRALIPYRIQPDGISLQRNTSRALLLQKCYTSAGDLRGWASALQSLASTNTHVHKAGYPADAGTRCDR
jgi:hypothetical protein